MNLRTRMAAAAAVAVAAAVVVVAVIVYVGVREQLRGEIDDSLRDRADGVARIVGRPRPAAPLGGGPGERPPLGGPDVLPPRADPEPFGGTLAYVQLVEPGGTVRRLPESRGELPVEPGAAEIARTGEGSEYADLDVDGTHLRVLTAGVPGGGAIQVARPLGEVDNQLHRIAVVLTLVGLAGVALSAAFGAAVAHAALAPVARFTRRTEELTANPDLSQRIEVEGNDELARLARSFNSTLDTLERSVEAQRQLVADASHELRTPIASLRANIQTLQHAERLPADEQEALRRDVIEELDELTALVADVVELARGAKLGEHADDVRLDEIVGTVVERARARAPDLGFELRAEPTLVRGDPQRIQRAVSNLVENAARWSPSGGSVEIELFGGALTVRDHGPGFGAEDLPHVFERFYRADAARAMPGSGLGLAIVRQAAEAHGGTVSAANAPDGGAQVRASFGPPLVSR
jgi:two-component system, OmpR family, sensor histidine kinase MprB